MSAGFEAALAKRTALTERLIQALEPMSMARSVSVVSSFIGLEQLEKIVEFQEGRS